MMYYFDRYLSFYSLFMNQIVDKFLSRTVWIWLPFYALYRLTKDFVNRG